MNPKKMYLVHWNKGFGEAFESIVKARKIALVHYRDRPIEITDFDGKVIGAVLYKYGYPIYITKKNGKAVAYRLSNNGKLGSKIDGY